MSRISSSLLSYCRMLVLLMLLPLVGGGTLYAQRYESQPMVILNADGRTLVDEAGHPWDPEDGVWKPSSAHLPHRTDLEVFVTNEVCADSIVAWSKTNSLRNSRLVSSFVNEYRQRDWLLHPHGDVYDLADVNPIAEAIYAQYQYLVDWWCMQNGDTRGAYSVALVLHPREGGPFEMIVLGERITFYDGDEPQCPLYYKNRVMLENVEKVHHVQRELRHRPRVQSRGQWITFEEHFSLSQPTDHRLLVERLVDVCTFRQDYLTLDARFAANPSARALNRRLMDHSLQLTDTSFMLPPMVFAGSRYLLTAQRQFRGDLSRDTLEDYRLATLRAFDATDGYSLQLRPNAGDTVLRQRWLMPDPSHFYSIRHVNYLHDHIRVDTTSTAECGCERQLPLQFLRVAARPAWFDCPPLQHGATDQVVSFRPRSRGELQDASYQLSLSFEKNSSRLDMRLGTNQQQMDSLVHKAYEITHDEEGHSIQQVSIIGISSPEGRRDANLRLSHQRSQALADRLRAMGGSDLRYARFDITLDSVAPWSAVADIIMLQHPEHWELAQSIRQGHTSQQHPVIDQALEQLRQVQVTYAYKAMMETPSDAILQRFWRGDDVSHWPAYYFYVLLQSQQLTWPEKVQLAQRLLTARESQVRRYCRDLQPSDSYGLVLPMAAVVLATEALQQGRYDAHILSPFIDTESGSGNVACFTRTDYENPVKFINLDVVLYNQILMLCGIGTDDALDQAYELAGILSHTPTVSPAFLQQYRPEDLDLLISCQNGDFLSDAALAEAIRQTNICNLFVINAARIYHLVDGDLQSLASHPEALSLLSECRDLLPTLQDQMGLEPAALYFTAVTEAWVAEALDTAHSSEHHDRAVSALLRLFGKEDSAGYIARLQGDSYLRGFYRNRQQRQHNIDLYLEAIEAYIQQLTAK